MHRCVICARDLNPPITLPSVPVAVPTFAPLTTISANNGSNQSPTTDSSTIALVSSSTLIVNSTFEALNPVASDLILIASLASVAGCLLLIVLVGIVVFLVKRSRRENPNAEPQNAADPAFSSARFSGGESEFERVRMPSDQYDIVPSLPQSDAGFYSNSMASSHVYGDTSDVRER